MTKRTFVFLAALSFCLSFFSRGVVTYAADFSVASGDVAGLIAAINTANANGEPDTINLAPGLYTLTTVDNGTGGGANGLPVITSVITINGGDAETTSILIGPSPAPDSPAFRIFSIAISGNLTINRMTVRGGDLQLRAEGHGLAFLNAGSLTVDSSVISGHRGDILSGVSTVIYSTGKLNIVRTHLRDSSNNDVIWNAGAMTIESSSVTGNYGWPGIISNYGEAIIRNSTFSDNFSVQQWTIMNSVFNSAGTMTAGTMTIVGSTIASNGSVFAHGGVAGTGGVTRIINSTITENSGGGRSGIPGSAVRDVELQNTIVEGNDKDCGGINISAGNNFVGDTCDGIQLLPSDLTGDPGLDAFVDDGAPGHGRFPLLASSPAIDHGNYSICTSDPSLATDQVGLPRRNACDIGSSEFFPIVNDALTLTGISTSFDPSPVPGGSSGTFLVSAIFRNNSTQTIGQPFVQVSTLSEGNLLLNAEGGRGSVGAWLPLPGSGPFAQGASRAVQLRIGLQQLTPFTFLVNVLGDQ
jgi:hypothetical protein